MPKYHSTDCQWQWEMYLMIEKSTSHHQNTYNLIYMPLDVMQSELGFIVDEELLLTLFNMIVII